MRTTNSSSLNAKRTTSGSKEIEEIVSLGIHVVVVSSGLRSQPLKEFVAARDPVTIIDVRNTNSLGESNDKIPGSIHIKLCRLRSRLKFAPLKDVPKDREIITYCACPGDETSTRAAEVLVEAGFTRVRALKAGWRGWLQVGGPIEQSRR